jgi:hypothetical protein
MYREEARLEKLWWDACKKEQLKSHSVEVRTAVEAHRGYMTNKEKINQDIECMKRLNGRRMFGKVNPNNIRYHEVVKDVLSAKQFYDLMVALIEKAKESKKSISYYIKQARHEFGAIRGLDEKHLKRIYNAIKNGIVLTG